MSAEHSWGRFSYAPLRREIEHRLGAPRFQTVDLNRLFCDRRWCYPVIGGAPVQKDLHHLTAAFVRTRGPFLLDAVRRLDLT